MEIQFPSVKQSFAYLKTLTNTQWGTGEMFQCLNMHGAHPEGLGSDIGTYSGVHKCL